MDAWCGEYPRRKKTRGRHKGGGEGFSTQRKRLERKEVFSWWNRSRGGRRERKPLDTGKKAPWKGRENRGAKREFKTRDRGPTIAGAPNQKWTIENKLGAGKQGVHEMAREKKGEKTERKQMSGSGKKKKNYRGKTTIQ